MDNKEIVYLFRGITTKNKRVLKALKDSQGRSITYSVSASSQDALPNNAEMDKIMRVCPPIVFRVGIKRGLQGPQKKIDLASMMQTGSSIFYIDKGAQVHYHGRRISLRKSKSVKVVVSGTEVQRVLSVVTERSLS